MHTTPHPSNVFWADTTGNSMVSAVSLALDCTFGLNCPSLSNTHAWPFLFFKSKFDIVIVYCTHIYICIFCLGMKAACWTGLCLQTHSPTWYIYMYMYFLSRHETSQLNWALPSDTFPRFAELLSVPTYTRSVLLGMTVSVGGLTESLVSTRHRLSWCRHGPSMGWCSDDAEG